MSNPWPPLRAHASCYTRHMRWWRHCTLAQAIAIALLLWTALDLSNERLCALEDEARQSILITITATKTVAAGSSDSTAAHTPQHVDDCFCCSHCVEVSSAMPAPVALTINQDPVPLVPSLPHTFGTSLYHPPLA